MRIHVKTKIIAGIATTVFTFYWIITLLYCSPDNYIRIQYNNTLNTFDKLFFQRWSFFAPPPNFNYKLYFTYYNKDSAVVSSVEVVEVIQQEKSNKAPFNMKEQLLDYSINNSLHSIRDLIVRYNNINNYLTDTNVGKSKKKIDSVNINFSLEKLPSFNILYNYSLLVKDRILSEKNIPKNQITGVKITATSEYIPKFSERNKVANINYQKREELLFSSQILKL